MVTIDHHTLVDAIKAGIIRDAAVIGQNDGWGLLVSYGKAKRALAARRGNIRVFRRFESLVSYLRNVGINHFRVDSSSYQPERVKKTRRRPDTAERMKRQAEAMRYDRWFRQQVGEAIRAANRHDAVLHDAEEVFDQLERRIAVKRARHAH